MSYDELTHLPRVPGVRHRQVTTTRLTHHVAEAGDGPPVLLVHGWPQHWYAWWSVIPALAVDHHVVAVDLRGSGWSDAPRSGYGTRDQVADLVALLDALGLDRVLVAGADWGGWLALSLALSHPGRVSGVVAAGTAGPWLTARPILRHAWWYLTTVPYETPLVGRTVARWLPALTRAVLRASAVEPPDRRVLDSFTDRLRDAKRARASEAVQRQRGYVEVVPTLLGRYRSQRLAVPALLLVGDRDPGLSVAACATAVPHGVATSVRSVPHCGHLVAEEQPGSIITAVRDLDALASAYAESGE